MAQFEEQEIADGITLEDFEHELYELQNEGIDPDVRSALKELDSSTRQIRSETEQIRRVAAVELEIYKFLKSHQEYSAQCNIPVLRKCLLKQNGPVTQESIARAVQALGDNLVRKAPKAAPKSDEEIALEERQELLAELISLGAPISLLERTQHVPLQDGRKGVDPVAARKAIFKDASKLVMSQARMPIEELRQTVADLRRYRQLQKGDRRTLVDAARQEQIAHNPKMFKGFEPIPADCDARKLTALIQNGQYELLKKKHGLEAINNRLAGRI
jgi:hypothetical protein